MVTTHLFGLILSVSSELSRVNDPRVPKEPFPGPITGMQVSGSHFPDPVKLFHEPGVYESMTSLVTEIVVDSLTTDTVLVLSAIPSAIVPSQLDLTLSSSNSRMVS